MTVPCSDWSIGRSPLHCSLIDNRVWIGPKVGLASIVLLSKTMSWLVRRSVSPYLFYCVWPCSHWSLSGSRLHCSIVYDRVLIGPSVSLASIVLLSMTVTCSDWSIGRSHLHCSLVDDRVLIGLKVGLASIVLSLMTVFLLVRRSVSLPLFSCRWPCSDWSVGRSHLRCSIAHELVLIGPWSVSSPLFLCAWPCSDWSVGWSRLHCSIAHDRVLFGP